MTTCKPERIIKNSPQWEITRHRDGETADIIETIVYADGKSAGFILPGVECLQGPSQYHTLRNVWQFVKYNIKYRADRPGHERVKSPGALFASGTGDCKSLSIATGAILRSLGIPYRYRFTAYDGGELSHVYIIADGVTGPVVLDTVHTKFDDEVPYYWHKDIRTKTSPKPGLNGLQGVAVDASGLILGALLVWLIFGK